MRRVKSGIVSIEMQFVTTEQIANHIAALAGTGMARYFVSSLFKTEFQSIDAGKQPASYLPRSLFFRLLAASQAGDSLRASRLKFFHSELARKASSKGMLDNSPRSSRNEPLLMDGLRSCGLPARASS